jgi:AcrR family transcriptional regulator
MLSENFKKNRIMGYAFQKFTSIGVAQVTMDDIAKGVGMGKGTLYKYFPSKEVLVLQTIDFVIGNVEKGIEEILSDEKLSTIQKLNLYFKTVTGKLSSINPMVLEYLQRSMPEAYEMLERSRERIIMNTITRIFVEGKNTGTFDSQTDEKLVAYILVGAANQIVTTQIIKQMDYSVDQLINRIIEVLVKGCLTEEGRKLFS